MQPLIYKDISLYDMAKAPNVLLVKGGYHVGVGRWNPFAGAWQLEAWGIVDRDFISKDHVPVFVPDGFYEINQPVSIFGYDELFGWNR